MARFETRDFGSKKQLLVFPNKREIAAIKRTLGMSEYGKINGHVGLVSVAKFKGHLKLADDWQPYLVLEK